jgi:hypothetical protein
MKKISAYAMPGIPKRPIPFLKDLWDEFSKIAIERYKYVSRPPGRKNPLITEEITFLSLKVLVRKDNNNGIVYIRQMFAYYIRERFNKKHSLKSIADIFNRDHTTIISNLEVFSGFLDSDSPLPTALSHIKLTVREDYTEVTKLMNQLLN